MKETLTETVEIRLSREMKCQWQALAERAGLTLSAWIRRKVEGVPTVATKREGG